MAGEEGALIPTEGISQDVLGNPAIKSFIKEDQIDIGGVLKSYLSQQDLIGRKGVPLPKDTNDAEGLRNALVMLGLPKTADEYLIPKLEELKDLVVPDGYPIPTEERIKAFRKVAHETGLLPSQVALLFKWYISEGINEFNQYNESYTNSRNASETALRSKWGKAYEPKKALAEKVLTAFADKEGKFVKFLKEEELHIHPQMIEFLASIGEKMGEDTLIKGITPLATKTPQEAEAEINKIMGDKEHPYHKANHPEHQAAIEHMQNLHKMAYPEKTE